MRVIRFRGQFAPWERLALPLACLLAILTLGACAPMAPAPVEQRESRLVRQSGFVPTVYSVRQGDTLYSIAFRYRLDWREVAAWNRIDPPYLIRPGQTLRLVPPPRRLADAPDRSNRAPTTRPQPTPAVPPTVTRPEPEPEPEVRQPPPEREPPVESDRMNEPVPDAVSAGPTRRVAGIDWQWPTAGRVSRVFDPAATRRGIGISGREGQAVVAAADGEVVYSGTALIGYGELIIIKHSDTLLSAYAHNRVRLVEEGARIRAGQPIAEMGISDRNEEILHFEVRRNGDPVDPLDFLPRK